MADHQARPVTASGRTVHPVRALQDLLRARGHVIAVDGIFGPQADAAVKAFQNRKDPTANGAVGPETWKAPGHLAGAGQRHALGICGLAAIRVPPLTKTGGTINLRRR